MEMVVTSYKLLIQLFSSETLHYFRRIEISLSRCGLGVHQ